MGKFILGMLTALFMCACCTPHVAKPVTPAAPVRHHDPRGLPSDPTMWTNCFGEGSDKWYQGCQKFTSEIR